MPDVRRLEVLCAVARAGSLSAAGVELNYTPSAVSQHLAALERETRSALVIRGPRGARLTEAGRVLVEHAEGILARLEDAQHALDDLRELRAGRVRLASFHSAGAALMPEAVARFRARHPDVGIVVREVDPEDAPVLVRGAQVDVALYFRYSDLPTSAGVDEVCDVRLLDDPIRIALPVDHELAEEPEVDLKALADAWWVQCATPTCAPLLTRLANRAGFEPAIGFRSVDYTTVLGFVAAGLGVALVPQLVLTESSYQHFVVRPIAGNAPVRQISAITAADPHWSPAVNAMIAVLKSQCAVRD